MFVYQAISGYRGRRVPASSSCSSVIGFGHWVVKPARIPLIRSALTTSAALLVTMTKASWAQAERIREVRPSSAPTRKPPGMPHDPAVDVLGGHPVSESSTSVASSPGSQRISLAPAAVTCATTESVTALANGSELVGATSPMRLPTALSGATVRNGTTVPGGGVEMDGVCCQRRMTRPKGSEGMASYSRCAALEHRGARGAGRAAGQRTADDGRNCQGCPPVPTIAPPDGTAGSGLVGAEPGDKGHRRQGHHP